MKAKQEKFRSFLFSFLVLTTVSCSAPNFDITTLQGRRAIINEVHKRLSSGLCDSAIDLIEPLYNSAYSDNEIRLVRASAHGCRAGINYFDLLNELLQNSGSLTVNGGLWTFLTEYFYNSTQTVLEDRYRSGWFGTDALMAILNSGVVIPTAYQINASTNNKGSILVEHRTNESNLYLIFISMAVVGATQGRYGDPDTTTYQKNADLSWISTSLMDTEGCAYSSGIVNMLDGINEASDFVGPMISSTLSEIGTAFTAAINQACDLGCQGLNPDLTASGDANCTFAAGECTPCPNLLRYRFSCADTTTSYQSSCAASGVVRYINDDPLGNGWPDA